MYFTWTLFHQLLEFKIFSLEKHITDNGVKNAYPVQTSDDTDTSGHGTGLNVYLSSVEHNSTAKKLILLNGSRSLCNSETYYWV